jgi:hypothetical protein
MKKRTALALTNMSAKWLGTLAQTLANTEVSDKAAIWIKGMMSQSMPLACKASAHTLASRSGRVTITRIEWPWRSRLGACARPNGDMAA